MKNIKIKENKDKQYYIWIAMAVFFAINIYRVSNYYIICHEDDFGYIANAAYLAGYNWNPYTGLQTKYFGYGFSIFAAICFKLGLDSIGVYRLLLMCVVGCQALMIVLLYKLMVCYLGIGKKEASIISFISGIGILSPQCGIYFLSEVPYAFTYVLVTYLLIASINVSKKKKIIYSVLIGCVSGYSYSIHARYLITIVSIIVILVWYRVIYKKSLINYVAFLGTLVLSTLLCIKGAHWFQETLYNVGYLNTTNNEIMNGNEALTRITGIPDVMKFFFCFQNMKDIFLHFLSLLSTFYVITGGFVAILYIIVLKKLKGLFFLKADKKDVALDMLTISGGFGFLLMNIMIAINGAMESGNVRFLVYFRYALPFVCLMSTLALVNYVQNRDIDIRFSIWILIWVITKSVILYYIEPSFDMYWSSYHTVEHLNGFFYSGESYSDYFVKLLLIATVFSALIYWAYTSKKIVLLIGALILTNIAYCNSEDSYYQEISYSRYLGVDDTEKFFRNNNTSLDIYYLQGSYSGRLRFALYDMDMMYLLNAEDVEDVDLDNSLLLSDRTAEYIKDKIDNVPKYQIILDKNEYIYTSNDVFFNEYKNQYQVEILQ